MERLLGPLALVLVFASVSHSQVTYGVKGGIAYANVTGVDASGTSPIRGFVGGAYLNISIPHIPSIQPELLFCTKGENGELGSARIAIFYNPGRITAMRFSYLEVPVLIKLRFSMPFLKPDLYFGPAMGILLSATGNYDTTGLPTRKIDITNGLRSVDWGIAFGVSVKIFVVRIDGRGTLGLSSLYNNNTGLAVRNEVWSLMMEIPLN